MKQLIILFMCTASLFCSAQDLIILNSGDTIHGAIISSSDVIVRIKKDNGITSGISPSLIRSMVKDKEYSEPETAGRNLMEASSLHFKGLAMSIAGTIVVYVGLALLPHIAAVAIIGGVITLVGAVSNELSWIKIRDAGRMLRRHNL